MSVLGRKKSLVASFFIIGIMSIAILIFEMKYLGTFLFISRFFMKNTFSMLLPLTTEIYPTFYRTMGYSFASGMGRIGAFVSAFIIYPLFWWESFYPFISFALISIFAAFTTLKLRRDTTGA